MIVPRRKFPRTLAMLSAAGFVVFFIWIVVIADKADGVPWWSFILGFPHGDKVGHLGLIGTLSLLCNLAFPTSEAKRFPFILTRTSLVLLVLLTLEELSQAFIPSRNPDFLDWLADLAGLLLGQYAAAKLIRLSRWSAAPTRSR